MANVTFDAVTKRFDDVVAVDRLDLEIEDGEFMVLLGPSGCGKTTALRMIAGLDEISDGVLRIGGDVVNNVEAADRDISMVFQSYALYPHMTVKRNIESPLLARKYPDPESGELRKLTRAERDERIDEAARILGLQPYLARKPGALSGGQRQRVALARAFVGRPRAYLMDEPLSNLDAKLRAQTRIELVDMHRRIGTTIIYVTHDQVEAMTMADRVAVMSMGQLQQVGTPQEIYDRPINTFVAQFIGTPPMNCLDAEIRDGSITVGGGTLPMPVGSAASSGAMVVGVRPEHLRIDTAGGIPATVRAVEWLGHEVLVSAEVGETMVILRRAGLPDVEVGDEIRLGVDAEHVHLFDPETTERLS